MKFQGITGNFAGANADALAVPVFKGEKATSGVLKDLDRVTGGLIASVMRAEEFKGDSGQIAFLRFRGDRFKVPVASHAHLRRRRISNGLRSVSGHRGLPEHR